MSSQVGHSGIRDNHSRGAAGGFLRDVVAADTKLSFVSAYFTIHTYGVLGEVLEQAESLRFLFGEHRFVWSLDTENKQFRKYRLTDEGLAVNNQLEQRQLAKQRADWIRRKVEIRSVTRSRSCMPSS